MIPCCGAMPLRRERAWRSHARGQAQGRPGWLAALKPPEQLRRRGFAAHFFLPASTPNLSGLGGSAAGRAHNAHPHP